MKKEEEEMNEKNALKMNFFKGFVVECMSYNEMCF